MRSVAVLRGVSVALACSVSSAASSATIYVDPAATGANNGSSWPNAYTSLAVALNASASFDEIWVKDGTYYPGTARADTFVVKQGVKVYGGFAGGETLRSQRVQTPGDTVLSGVSGPSGFRATTRITL